MAEDRWSIPGLTSDNATKPRIDLSDLTASEYLLFTSDKFILRSDIAADPRLRTARGGLTLAPRDESLPSARISAEGGAGQRPSATLSVGNQLLDYERRLEDVSSGKGGPVTTDTVSAKAGPLSARYSKRGQPNNQGLKQTNYSGSLNMGPVQLSAQRNLSSQDVVDPLYARFYRNTGQDTQTDTVGASGSFPLFGGMVSGGVNRQFVKNRSPQELWQETRPMSKNPNVTDYRLGWKGPVGPGSLDLSGNFRNIRRLGTEYDAKAKYTLLNPLGWGGELLATGEYKNPVGAKSSAEGRLQYRIPLGGSR